MNYIYSEFYRLFHLKSLYLLTIVWVSGFLSICYLFSNIAAENDRSAFYKVSWTLGVFSIFFLIPIVSSLLAGKNLKLIKQSLAFGISRNQIYLIKLVIIVVAVLLIIILNVLIGYLFSLYFLNSSGDSGSLNGFKFLNIIPLILSAIALCQLMDFGKLNGAVNVMIIFLVYIVSGDMVSFLDQYLFKTDILAKIFPSVLIDTGMRATGFDGSTFFVGCLWTVAFISIGLLSFRKKDVR